ncbi:MAG: exodeoxyribonuclease III [Acidobacteria bacterium]|nr:MAG: exodeoxyribonuclease III [Acidobacteriota bacterium]
MRIISWNVNGLRAAARKGFGAWLEGSGAEIVALQEVRARQEQVPRDLRRRPGWHFDLAPAERPGYSGVALFSRRPPDAVQHAVGEPEIDAEGRLQLARFGGLLLVNGYFPNGNGTNRDNSRIPFKLRFYRTLYHLLEPHKEAGRPILVAGDLNTAHREIDLARPKQNRDTSGFTDEERAELDRWLTNGWVDTFRHFEPGPGHYTWWSQRFGVRERNVGWRIDYVLASPGAMPFLKGAAIHPEVMGSDHCPISVEVSDAIVEEKAFP